MDREIRFRNLIDRELCISAAVFGLVCTLLVGTYLEMLKTKSYLPAHMRTLLPSEAGQFPFFFPVIQGRVIVVVVVASLVVALLVVDVVAVVAAVVLIAHELRQQHINNKLITFHFV